MKETPKHPGMSFVFSQLLDSRVEEAFALLHLVAKSIQSQGRSQRISKTSLDTYRNWQAEKANYIVTEDDQIIGLLTCRRELLEHWPDFIDLGPIWMLRAIATHPDHGGKGVGTLAVSEAVKRCGVGEPTYLDCVSEFLPSYYQKLGFEPIGQQVRSYPDGESYDITLMRYDRKNATTNS